MKWQEILLLLQAFAILINFSEKIDRKEHRNRLNLILCTLCLIVLIDESLYISSQNVNWIS